MRLRQTLALSIMMATSGLVLASGKTEKEPTILNGTVAYVVDGDRFILDTDEERHYVRMKWIDAPNDGQPLNEDARRFLADLIEGKPVTVISQNGEVNGCYYGEVVSDTQNYNVEMLAAGYANIVNGAPKDYIKTTVEAKNEKRGVWNENTRVPSGSGYLTSIDYSGHCNFEDENIVDYKTEEALKEGREQDRFIELLLNIIIGVCLGVGLAKGLNHFDDPRIAKRIRRNKRLKGEAANEGEDKDE